MKFRPLLLSIFLIGSALYGQNGIQATGTANISVNPDQAQMSVGVVTQGNSAQEAASLNSTQATAVQNALKTLLGTSGTIQTISYSVYPRYNNANPPAIIGYTASNTVQVVTTNLGILGNLIDTANQAGANNVSGISFGLQNPEPVVQQALTQASKQAIAHAGAIAAGFNGKVGSVLSAQQSSSYAPIAGAPGDVAAGSSTPVQTGTVSVTASVTVNVALVQ